MTERREYELSDAQLDRLLDASRSLPYMVFAGVAPPSPQENANSAWRALARELGFVWDTVRPVAGKDQHFFTAEASA